MFLPTKYSFRLVSAASLKKPKTPDAAVEADSHKRTFLRVAGLAGLGLVATAVLPKKAEALIMGGAPSSTVVGLKDITNTRINPATEETLALVQTKTAGLTYSGSDLLVQASSTFATQVENASNVLINPATEETLALIRAQTNKLTFDGSNNLLTSVGGSGNTVGVKNTANTQIDPATEDSLVYLRRIVKIMESQAAVDTQNRQRVTIDSWGSVLTGPGTASGLSVPRVAVATDSAFNAAITSLNGWNQQMFQDSARNTYANGIRANVVFA